MAGKPGTGIQHPEVEVSTMPEKAIADLQEMSDPRYDGCPGSDYEEYCYEPEEIALHQENLQKAIEYDQALSMHQGFPEEYSDPAIPLRHGRGIASHQAAWVSVSEDSRKIMVVS
jgi:hypothetical protein